MTPSPSPTRWPADVAVRAWAVEGIGEVVAGDDLARLVVDHLAEPLLDGDVVVVTSKVVSKALGLVTDRPREDVLAAGTDRLVARRGGLRIVRTHHGLVLAAAGVDASNTRSGTLVPLPPDPDASARELRDDLARAAGVEVGVVVTDTAGRAWRTGQTDIAIGSAGVLPAVPLDGAVDVHGNRLSVTEPAVVDEVAGLADLVAGKLGGLPVVVVRGLPRAWLQADAPGAASLVRAEPDDLFGLGARDAVLAALAHDPAPRGFPAPDPGLDLVALAADGTDPALARVDPGDDGTLVVTAADDRREAHVAAGVLAERLRVLARVLGVDVTVLVAAGG